jgi:putative oxidoreductase
MAMNTYAYSAFKNAGSRSRAPLRRLVDTLDFLSPLGDLLLRLWVAWAFWVSGLTKIRSWDSTLYLFENEYSVPLLDPDLAAYVGTSVELGAPVLLALGVFGRLAAAVLFLFNIVAVISYPDLGPAGLEQHKTWGVMALVSLLHGPGKLSADHWIFRRWFGGDE